jgi:hypothetical protein
LRTSGAKIAANNYSGSSSEAKWLEGELFLDGNIKILINCRLRYKWVNVREDHLLEGQVYLKNLNANKCYL